MLWEERMHTKKDEKSAREIDLVLTTNGGTIVGCAGMFEDRADADRVKNELVALVHDCLIETREKDTVLLPISGDDVVPVKTVAETDVIDMANGQTVTASQHVEEAMVKAIQAPVSTTTLTSHPEIQVNKDDTGRTIIEFTGTIAQLIAENARACCLDTAAKIRDGKPTGKFRSNLAGQIGEAAGQVFLHGPVAGMARYRTVREVGVMLH